MKEHRDCGGDCGGGGCYFHPKEVVIGVCPLCLHEKLLNLLASSKQRQQYSPCATKSIINIFAFPSLLNPLHFLRHSSSNFDHDPDHDLDASTSQEDSFISMKFEDNGAGSWEGRNMNMNMNMKVKEEDDEEERKKKSLVGSGKSSRSSLRWRKRIGQAFQLIRWKRANKANVWHVGTKVEGVKVMRKKHKQGWIASLTKKKTTK